jgi:hypothetical protein
VARSGSIALPLSFQAHTVSRRQSKVGFRVSTLKSKGCPPIEARVTAKCVARPAKPLNRGTRIYFAKSNADCWIGLPVEIDLPFRLLFVLNLQLLFLFAAWLTPLQSEPLDLRYGAIKSLAR